MHVHKALMRGTGATFYAIVPSLQRESEIEKTVRCLSHHAIYSLIAPPSDVHPSSANEKNLSAIKVELGWQREDIAHS